jgi:predicted metal-dependent phosphoesterase TrpH
MKKYLLPKEGNFYKANMHMHTTISDGKMTPEETKEAFLKEGYSIVAFTDHEIMVPHPELTDENFIALTSVEISINERRNIPFIFTKTYHLNLYSKTELLEMRLEWKEDATNLKITKYWEHEDISELYKLWGIN